MYGSFLALDELLHPLLLIKPLDNYQNSEIIRRTVLSLDVEGSRH